MKTLLEKILNAAALAMWQKDARIGKYVKGTLEREPNLSFHYARELINWLPWLECDFDLTKSPAKNRRPDIMFHLRGTQLLNFLVIEMKRRANPDGPADDLAKITKEWFGDPYYYHYGASVILDEDHLTAEVTVLERVARVNGSAALTGLLREPLRPTTPSDLPTFKSAITEMLRNIEQLGYAGLDDEKKRAHMKKNITNVMSGHYCL